MTDQTGKQRISKTNALGQLTDIWEIMAASDASTVSVTFPSQSIAYGYQTSYSYDTLNNLTTVSQGAQTRTFSYSSLSRLLTANNPESGAISYNYDDNGNLTNKTDARSVLTTYTYDNLNRVKTRNYSSEPSGQTATPNVTYSYDDTNVAFSKGKLTKVSSSLSETKYTAFDLLGKVLSSQQITDGQTYNSAYTYNLSGALIEETYPSGRVVKNTLDNDGDLAQVQSKKANDTFKNYANSFNYTAAGAVSSMRLGNGLWENTSFNSRLQPTQIGLGSGATSQNLLKLNYDYGSTQNNGNIQSQTITVPTVGSNTGFTATQTYTYDSLNRLKDAKEMIGTTETWKQTFTFDRYGNRNFDEANTTTLPKNCGTSPNTTVCAGDVPIVNPSVNTANNRLNGYTFDNAGNTTKDAQSRKFTYDGENKQIKVETVNSGGTVTGTLGEYFYDGDGKRVKKVSATETTIFIYDASGKMVAEYSTQLATIQQVSYLTNDHLGSPRINTDANGAVTARHDYQPFGEEIATSQRIAGLNYNSDEIRKKFTSYERDKETDLDFAQARYYAKNFGRFNSPDPIMLQLSRLVDPQAINLYVYVRNNPLIYVDPDGRYYVGTDGNRVKVKYLRNENGEITGIKKLGKNATEDLKRIANLANTTKSEDALNKLIEGDKSVTRVNLEIKKVGRSFTRPHDKDGPIDALYKADRVPDYICDSNGQNCVYREITITLTDWSGDEEFLEFVRGEKQAPELTSDIYLLSDFGHEIEHGTSKFEISITKNFIENKRNARAKGLLYFSSAQDVSEAAAAAVGLAIIRQAIENKFPKKVEPRDRYKNCLKGEDCK